MLTGTDFLEALDGIFNLNKRTRRAGENFCHVERLGEEALDFPGAGDGDTVLFRQFVHA